MPNFQCNKYLKLAELPTNVGSRFDHSRFLETIEKFHSTDGELVSVDSVRVKLCENCYI